jgi:hypothetical protein
MRFPYSWGFSHSLIVYFMIFMDNPMNKKVVRFLDGLFHGTSNSTISFSMKLMVYFMDDDWGYPHDFRNSTGPGRANLAELLRCLASDDRRRLVVGILGSRRWRFVKISSTSMII